MKWIQTCECVYSSVFLRPMDMGIYDDTTRIETQSRKRVPVCDQCGKHYRPIIKGEPEYSE